MNAGTKKGTVLKTSDATTRSLESRLSSENQPRRDKAILTPTKEFSVSSMCSHNDKIWNRT
jgi:hypothetical protein